MLKSDQNGEGFYYIVSYKRRNAHNAREVKVNVTGWQESELVIKNQEMFREYEISVQSANSEGLAPSASVDRKLGYSGQDGTSQFYYHHYFNADFELNWFCSHSPQNHAVCGSQSFDCAIWVLLRVGVELD